MLYYVDIISSNPREGATKEKRKKKKENPIWSRADSYQLKPH